MLILDIAIFFVSAKNKRKFVEQTTEEFYTSSFEEIPKNGFIADEIIQQYSETLNNEYIGRIYQMSSLTIFQ